MIQAWSYEQVREDLAIRFRRDGFRDDAVKMVGLLFARPDSALARSEIVPNLNYFHQRAGRHVHFFCAGYGAYWPPDWVQDAQVVTTIDGVEWLFSARLFNDFRAELDNRTKNWRYSGGTDLILTNSVWSAGTESADLDLKTAVAMNLDQAVADGAIPDVERWFEKIFSFAEASTDTDPTWGFATSAGLRTVRSGLVNVILSLLPGSMGSEAKRLPTFLLTDFTGALSCSLR